MKFVISVAIAFLSFQVHAQINSRDSLMGTWVCIEVIQIASKEIDDNPNLKGPLEIMKKAYLGATFTFGKDGLFHHTVTKTSQDFSEMLKFVNGQKWTFDPVGKSISIGRNVMKMDLVEANNSIYFASADMPLWMKVERKR